MNTDLGARYIKAKYENPTIEALETLLADAIKEVRQIERDKSDVFARYPGVHGRFQQSQLDVLDIRQNKVLAIVTNTRQMIAAR